MQFEEKYAICVIQSEDNNRNSRRAICLIESNYLFRTEIVCDLCISQPPMEREWVTHFGTPHSDFQTRVQKQHDFGVVMESKTTFQFTLDRINVFSMCVYMCMRVDSFFSISPSSSLSSSFIVFFSGRSSENKSNKYIYIKNCVCFSSSSSFSEFSVRSNGFPVFILFREKKDSNILDSFSTRRDATYFCNQVG